MTVDADVAIVGFGPGGEVLASLLGQAGHRVVVFDKFPAPYGLPRMSTLDGEIARLLQHTSDGAKALTGSIAVLHGHLYGADGEQAAEQDWSGQIGGHPSHLSLHQPNIEAAMQERVASCPTATVHWGSEVVGVEDLGDHVRVTYRPSAVAEEAPAENAEQQVTARYVVGMDGASSFVRTTAGIELEVVREHDDRWVLTDFDILDDSVPTPETELHMEPAEPYYWGPNGAGRCRTDVRIMDDFDPVTILDHERGYTWLEQKIGIPREAVQITRRIVYRFRSQYAKTFRKGRVFIGGDAAHAMTPHMAQGSCSAMRDGINLAWKLDLVLSGRASEELLDTYETERQAHVIPLVHGSLMTWSMFVESDRVKAAARDAYLRSGQMAPAPMPILTTGLLHRDAAGAPASPAGSLAPQGRVRLDSREGLLDDLVGFGFQLISTMPLDDVLTDGQLRTLQHLGAKILVLGDGEGQVADLDGTYADYLGDHAATLLVARPDFYVFGAAAGRDASRLLVEDLLQQLSLASELVPA